MFGFLNMLNNYESRKVAHDEDVDGEGIVDTCSVTDSAKPFETAISHPDYNDGKWIIVELYSTREEALLGHQKWVETLRGKPESLSDVNECELQDIAQAIGHNLHESFPRRKEAESDAERQD